MISKLPILGHINPLVSFHAPLIVHRRNRFELTAEGKWVLDRCSKLFDSALDLKSELHGFSDREPEGTLCIAVSHSLAIAFMPQALKKYSRLHPQVKFELRTGDAVKSRELLRTRQVELAISLDDGLFENYQIERILEGKFVLASSKKTKQTPNRAQYIIGDKGTEVAQLKLSYKNRYSVPLPIHCEVQSWELIASLCERGLGIGLLPDFILRYGQNAQLKAVKSPLELPKYEMVWACREGSHLSLAAQKFKEIFEKCLS